jgi:ribonuclease HIII
MSSSFTATIDLSLAPKLREDLLRQGFELSEAPYALFRATKRGISCVLYQSGKLVVQGKELRSFIEFYLEPEILKEFRFSHPEAHLDRTPRIGMDEAGKGDFFGPLCVAAVYADAEGIKNLHQWGVKDSKAFSDAAILKLAGNIRTATLHTVIRLFPLKYNELYARFKNLNRMLSWAHVTALQEVSANTDCRKAILDQFAKEEMMLDLLRQKHLDFDLEQRVRGEADLIVAAASILARAGFLQGLAQLSQEVGCSLPKGAGPGVVEVGIQLVRKQGPDILSKVAKLHFKTKDEILARSSL